MFVWTVGEWPCLEMELSDSWLSWRCCWPLQLAAAFNDDRSWWPLPPCCRRPLLIGSSRSKVCLAAFVKVNLEAGSGGLVAAAAVVWLDFFLPSPLSDPLPSGDFTLITVTNWRKKKGKRLLCLSKTWTIFCFLLIIHRVITQRGAKPCRLL